jgi:transposase
MFKSMVPALAENAARADTEIAQLKTLDARADARVARLTSIVKMLERARYGKRSEKLALDPLNEEQQAFVFDEIERGLGAIQAELGKAGAKVAGPCAPRPHNGFAARLERVKVVIEPEDPPGCKGVEKVCIGEDVSERLDVTPRQIPGNRDAPTDCRSTARRPSTPATTWNSTAL